MACTLTLPAFILLLSLVAPCTQSSLRRLAQRPTYWMGWDDILHHVNDDILHHVNDDILHHVNDDYTTPFPFLLFILHQNHAGVVNSQLQPQLQPQLQLHADLMLFSFTRPCYPLRTRVLWFWS